MVWNVVRPGSKVVIGQKKTLFMENKQDVTFMPEPLISILWIFISSAEHK